RVPVALDAPPALGLVVAGDARPAIVGGIEAQHVFDEPRVDRLPSDRQRLAAEDGARPLLGAHGLARVRERRIVRDRYAVGGPIGLGPTPKREWDPGLRALVADLAL